MIKLAAYAALGLAGALLGLQIVGGLEYTEGGSLYTRASMIAAMVTLAALPVFIEAARRTGQRGIAAALFIAFCSFLAYSLPATTGRTGEVKEVKVTAAADVARIRDDIERTSKTLEWARQDWIAECGSGEGKKCRAKRNTVQALEDRKAKLEADLKAAGPGLGDTGSDLWAWATGLSAATIRKASVMAFAIGLDVVIWALIWFATAVLATPRKAVNDNRPAAADTAQTSFPIDPNGGRPVYTRARAQADVIQLVGRGKPIPSQETLSMRWGVGKGTVSKWLSAMEDDGLIQRETVGRCKAVRAA